MTCIVESEVSTTDIPLHDFIKKLENDLISLSENKDINSPKHIDKIKSTDNYISDIHPHVNYVKENIDIITYIILFFILNHDKTIMIFKNNINSTNNINLLFRSLLFGILIYIIKYKKII